MLSFLLWGIGIYFVHIILLNVLLVLGVPSITSILIGDLVVSFLWEVAYCKITHRRSIKDFEFHRSVALWFVVFVAVDLIMLML